MINTNISISSTDTVKAKVELYSGSTLVQTCTCADVLQKFTVSRTGVTNKYFGFGVCHKLNMELIDMENSLELSGVDLVKISYTNNETDFIAPYPSFINIKSERNESENVITLTGFDLLEPADKHTVNELSLVSYTIREFAVACAQLIGAKGIKILNLGTSETIFDTLYEGGANLEGTEGIRQVLSSIAEVTQTIFYIDNEDYLVFKRLDKDGAPVLSITKDDYFELVVGAQRTLAAICHATELGDNLKAELTDVAGDTQYIRDNPFWEVLESTEVAENLNTALGIIGGFSLYQFSCDWVGNYLLEIGDKIEAEKENSERVTTYLLNDTTTYDGSIAEISEWNYDENDTETESNPSLLDEILNQTFAKVDKVNQQIELVVSTANSNASAIAALQINTDSINASVREIQEVVNTNQETMEESIGQLTKEVSAKMDAESVQIAIQTELAEGVDNVTTREKKYTFNDSGLTIADSDSEISTRIDNDGMKVYQNNEEVLTADNQGVKAKNLHATTYLIIGANSRIEDYDNGQRTGCFWIGG